MLQFFLSRVGVWGRAALLALLIGAGLGLLPETALASHLRAGDIQAKPDTTLPVANRNARRIFFKMILYSTEGSNVVDEDKVTIFFGDGTSSCYRAIDRIPGGRRPIPGAPDTGLNIYTFEHTFPSSGKYVISYTGENRNLGVLNMSNSISQSFYISTTIYLDPTLGINRSPILTAPAVDKGGVSQVFVHIPGGFDADGDSLSYFLQPSRKVTLPAQDIVGLPCVGTTGNNTPIAVDVPNFHYPNDPIITNSNPLPVQVAYNGVPPGRPGDPAIFVQDPVTGQITWNAPIQAGTYNVAFRVEERRRTPLGYRLIGEVVRDMQINIINTNNLRPILSIPIDVCVVAGQIVTGTVTAADGVSATSTAQSAVTLFAYSGIIPPATFRQTQFGPPLARGTFTWQTQCSNVAQQPYQVVFKAQDSPNPVTPANQPLIDEQVWRITVVGPPPQGLRATPSVSSTGLNRTVLAWNTYACTNASRIYIYRKVGPGTAPGACVTGLPSSTGYVRIGSVPVTATTFADDNLDANGNPRSLDRGLTYCYRIYAEFPLPAGGASLASDEACAAFPGRSAQLKNVDVETTSATTGQITVRWTQPRSVTGAVFDGTPSYVLLRGDGLAPTTFAPVRTFASLNDTSFVDTNLNTLDRQYAYRLDFVRTFANGQSPVTETGSPASSVRTTVVPNNPATSYTVSWAFRVPWDNTARPVLIYRRSGTPGSAFAQVATVPTGVSGGTYIDRDPSLVTGQTYCYYVRTEGRYTPTGFLSSLLNKSQEQCRALIAPPCRPVLALKATNCDSLAALPQLNGTNPYFNRLSWTVGNTPAGCLANATSYRVYYREGATGAFALIGTTPQTTFTHANLPNFGGCYAVQGVGPGGVVSDTSNVACQDNCLFFSLPNVFTPNGDGQNAVFRPKSHSPVRRVHFVAFNRWGVKVFENTTTAADPVLINWDGGGPIGVATATKKVSDGIYFYLAEVEFADASNTTRKYKGWVEIIR